MRRFPAHARYLVLLLLALTLSACRPLALLGTSPAPRASSDIQPFFTTPTLIYPDKPAQRTDSPLLAAVVADIDAAQTSVDMASFDFDLSAITAALLRAERRGVVVRLVVDSENLSTPEVARETGRLERRDISVTFDHRSPFMHDKFIVLDEAIVWTGSWNITENDTYRNNNNFLRLASGALSAAYTREFEQMFGGTFGTAKVSSPTTTAQVGAARIEAYFSPQDGVAEYVLGRIAEARQSIVVMAFSYTADDVAQAMIAKQRAGVNVRGVFESRNARGTGADFGALERGGADVLEDGNCYVMHHKVIIIDERTVVTGSYNFTGSAERDNDENLLIIDDPQLAQAYLAEFADVYRQAQAPQRCR